MSKMDYEVLAPHMEQDKTSIQCENHRFAQYLEITRCIRDSNMTLEKEIGIYQSTTSLQVKEVGTVFCFAYMVIYVVMLDTRPVHTGDRADKQGADGEYTRKATAALSDKGAGERAGVVATGGTLAD